MTKEELNDPKYPKNYEVNTTLGKEMGLPTEYAAIKYFANPSGNGYSTQLAFSFRAQEFKVEQPTSFKKTMPSGWKMLFRSAYNGEWSDWENISASYDGLTTQSYDLKDLNAISIRQSFTPRYYHTSNQGVQNGPPVAQYISNNDDGMLWGLFNDSKKFGFQFAQNWNGAGLWCRDINTNAFGAWSQILRTGMRTFGSIFVDAKNEPTNPNGPYISLAIGDSDTGFNRGGNGIFGAVCNGINVIRFDGASAQIYPDASKLYTFPSIRNTVISTADPSLCNDGDIWLKYV